MNEPAIFYSREGLAERLDHPPVPHEDGTIDHFGQAIGCSICPMRRKTTPAFITRWTAKWSATTRSTTSTATT